MNAIATASLPDAALSAVPIERRAGARQRTCFAIGKLTVEGRHHVCLVRNLSDQGVGIEMDAPPRAGTRVRIDTRSFEPSPATVVWSRDRAAGLRLDAPCVPPAPDHRPRSPRFAWTGMVRVIVEDRLVDLATRDLALGGVGLATHLPARVGAMVVVLAGPFSLPGRICWHASGASGVRFTRPLSATELAALLAWNDPPAEASRSLIGYER